MNKRDYAIYAILAIAVVSIIVNFNMLDKMEELKSQQEQTRSQVDRQLRYEIDHLSQQIQEINEKNEWVSDREFKAVEERSTPEEIHLDLEWTFREVESDASITVAYREEGATEWEEVEANNASGSAYLASLVLSPMHTYEYKIMSEGDTIQSTETRRIPQELYQPIPLVTRGTGSGQDANGNMTHYSAELKQIEQPIFSFFNPKTVTAFVHYEEHPTEEINVGADQGIWKFRVEPEDKTITSIDLRVEYENGTIHEGEIYPDEQEYMESVHK
ncbi:hypothetical protein [Aquibacillus sediminis]|uniref:hypothetical protein n=1 Tax=Aquibacillus sediminis TaxID=2574734 RepID=UPI001108DFB4|nr:hypothetical protein [Aquibacillus sediminis]